jgi:hypothetical protein
VNSIPIRYAIDACALIDASNEYNLKKKCFTIVWDKFAELFVTGSLISSIEIYDELKDEDLLSWLKNYKSSFLPLTKEIQDGTTTILYDFPQLIKLRKKSSSNGDPFLIATAIEYSCFVVTNERFGDESTGDYRIPNVCRKYGIKCINLHEFIDQILE